MESPVKKLDFGAADKENNPDATVDDLAQQIEADHKPVVEEVKKVEKESETAVTKPDESDEPLLQENPNRFVLFPIKYHEVSDASERVKWFCHATGNTLANNTRVRSGKCTRRLRPLSGLPRRSISQRTCTTGTTVSPTTRSTSSHTFWPSSLPPMASSTRTSSSASAQKSRFLRLVASTVSRS